MTRAMLFVETSPFMCGFQLKSSNWNYAPRGRIRYVRYESCFSPQNGYGYYADIYLREFIRAWKRKTFKRRNIRLALLCGLRQNWVHDITYHICLFL